MKKFGIASILATGLTAGVLALAGPAQADIGHNGWVVNNTNPAASVPHVDTTVHQSR
jgi:hypothetical protein